MSIEETLQRIIREELARMEPRLAERVAGMLQGSKAANDTGDRFLDEAGCAAICPYSWATILEWIAEGKLKRYGTIRRALVSERELRCYLSGRAAVDVESQSAELDDAGIIEMAKQKVARKG